MVRCKIFSGRMQTEVEAEINTFFEENSDKTLLSFQQSENIIKNGAVNFYLFTITVMYQ